MGSSLRKVHAPRYMGDFRPLRRAGMLPHARQAHKRGNSPLVNHPFFLGRRMICCRKSPLTRTAAKEYEDVAGGRFTWKPERRRISWVSASILPLGCGKAGFIVLGKWAQAVWRYPAFRPPAGGGGDVAARAAGAQEGKFPSCESLLFSRTAHDLLPQISPDRDCCEKIRGRCGRPVREEVRAEKTFLGRCTPFSLGCRKGGAYCVRKMGGSCLALPGFTRAAHPEGRGGD